MISVSKGDALKSMPTTMVQRGISPFYPKKRDEYAKLDKLKQIRNI